MILCIHNIVVTIFLFMEVNCMLKLSKNELIQLANEGKTLWDLYEIL